MIDRQPGCHVTVPVDVKSHVDAAKLGWIKPDFEKVLACKCLAGNLYGDAGQRDSRRLWAGETRVAGALRHFPRREGRCWESEAASERRSFSRQR